MLKNKRIFIIPAIDPQGSNPGSPRSSSRGRDPAEISGSFPNFPNEQLHFWWKDIFFEW